MRSNCAQVRCHRFYLRHGYLPVGPRYAWKRGSSTSRCAARWRRTERGRGPPEAAIAACISIDATQRAARYYSRALDQACSTRRRCWTPPRRLAVRGDEGSGTALPAAGHRPRSANAPLLALASACRACLLFRAVDGRLIARLSLGASSRQRQRRPIALPQPRPPFLTSEATLDAGGRARQLPARWKPHLRDAAMPCSQIPGPRPCARRSPARSRRFAGDAAQPESLAAGGAIRFASPRFRQWAKKKPAPGPWRLPLRSARQHRGRSTQAMHSPRNSGPTPPISRSSTGSIWSIPDSVAPSWKAYFDGAPGGREASDIPHSVVMEQVAQAGRDAGRARRGRPGRRARPRGR